MLTANFRNGLEATRVANQLLKIKHRRFGSIDRESNFLVQAVGGEAGQVALMPDKDASKRELDQKIRQSTQFAVLVMRDEDKAEARKHFATPLLFSIHEAKGLEYDNIVLYRFISDHRAEFSEIVDGVDPADLTTDTLDYRRAKDKSDKSLEVYKFFVNALYVALTRAISNVYVIESDTAHPLFGLLEMNLGQVKVEARQSSLEDWQKEARKLELQGKQEQAEAIRRTILKQTPVPWPVFGEAKVLELLVKVFREQVPGAKMKQQLYEYATCHDEPQLAEWLAAEAKFDQAANFAQQRAIFGRKTYVPYFANHFKDILKQCEHYGIEHRLPMNLTPLMTAAAAGNVPLVEALLGRGADRDAVDHYGHNALHWALREGFRDAKFARGPLAALYELLAPASIRVFPAERLGMAGDDSESHRSRSPPGGPARMASADRRRARRRACAGTRGKTSGRSTSAAGATRGSAGRRCTKADQLGRAAGKTARDRTHPARDRGAQEALTGRLRTAEPMPVRQPAAGCGTSAFPAQGGHCGQPLHARCASLGESSVAPTATSPGSCRAWPEAVRSSFSLSCRASSPSAARLATCR